MLNLFIPSEQNDYKAQLLKKPFLMVFLVIILSFNFVIRSNTRAQDISNSINNQTLLQQHNNKRTEAGLIPLTYNELLERSAQSKADEMLRTDCWSHYCPDGRSPWEFFEDAEYNYIYAGENLAEGFFTVTDVMNAWMNSKTHRENIEKYEYQEVGFGIAYGSFQNVPNNIVIVVHFGTRPITPLINSINITSPTEGETISSQSTDVVGTFPSDETIEIYLNSELKGTARINDGIFTYKLELHKEGVNQLYTTIPSKQVGSEMVNFFYSPVVLSETISNVELDTEEISSTTIIKNGVNLFFIALLVILFLIDMVVLSRTQILKQERGYSHYHFVMLLITGLVFISGGFFGNLL